MSVVVLSPDRVSDMMHAAGHLVGAGVASVPGMPADTNPSHYLAQASPAGRLGWALAVARVASAAAFTMTYGDPVDVGGPVSWDTDGFALAQAGCGCGSDLGDLAVSLHSWLGGARYNGVSNGGSDFLPAPAAALLDGLRDSLPVVKNGLYGWVPDPALGLPADLSARTCSGHLPGVPCGA